jgi:hypothetical protein
MADPFWKTQMEHRGNQDYWGVSTSVITCVGRLRLSSRAVLSCAKRLSSADWGTALRFRVADACLLALVRLRSLAIVVVPRSLWFVVPP